MSKKKSDDLTCPGCGKKAIQPIEIWEHDFLTIHRIETVKVESRYGRGPWFMRVFADGCDKGGKIPRGLPVNPAIEMKHDENEGSLF